MAKTVTRPTRKAGVQNVPGLERTMLVLRALSAAPEAGLRQSDVAVATEFGKSTTHRLLSRLTAVGLVEQDPDSRRYHLGFELYVLGQAAAKRFGIIAIAKASLQRLVERTEDTVYMSVLAGMDAVCLARVEGSFPIKTLTMNVGDRRPLPVGSGALSMLAHYSDDEIDRILEANTQRYREYTFFDMAFVHAMIDQTRRDGFTFSDNLIDGMRALAVPILDPQGRPMAAITVSAISDRMKPQRRNNIIAVMRREVQRITQRVWPEESAGHAASRASP